MDARALALLDFWFGACEDPDFGQFRDIWFSSGSTAEFDESLRKLFLADYERAAASECDHWDSELHGCLALILLFDQIPRNIFRGELEAFATDHQARRLAQKMVTAGWDKQLIPVERQFCYLPFEHSEDLADQKRSVELFRTMPDLAKKQEWIDYAVEHMEIIDRFGRFPHRNDILGRENTADELKFLKETNRRFGTEKREAGADAKGENATGQEAL